MLSGKSEVYIVIRGDPMTKRNFDNDRGYKARKPSI